MLELDSKLNDGEKTIAHYLQAAGYYTGVSGKWHLDQTPKELGFDFSSTFYSNGTYFKRKIVDEGKNGFPRRTLRLVLRSTVNRFFENGCCQITTLLFVSLYAATPYGQ